MIGFSRWLALPVAFSVVAGSVSYGQFFTFAGITFNDSLTPTVASLIPAGVQGSASFDDPTGLTGNIVNFFSDPLAPGFDVDKSLGGLLGINPMATWARVVNFQSNASPPNLSTTVRHGVNLSWSSGPLANLPGQSGIVVYESGDYSVLPGGEISPEPIMARAFNETTQSWGGWYYFPHVSAENYIGSTTAGAFAYVFDFATLGVGPGELVGQLQIANMIEADRMSPLLSGLVLPEDNGMTSSLLPEPGENNLPLGVYMISFWDSDPLYVGVIPEPVSAVLLGLGGLVVMRRGRRAARA